ncbi:pentapeptide repeat-containing protein, partial [Escherichia coli]
METYNHTYRHHNFSHKDLSDLTFTACTFIRSDFRRANLRDTTFVNCKFIEQGDIEGCHFDVADLRDASFQQCQLAMANFSNANCYGIEFRGHCCKVSDEAAFCLIQRPYISKTLLTRRISPRG